MLHVYNLHSVFTAFEKKDGKDFSKNTVTFWHDIAYIISSFVLYLID